jgi:hypothetical protein
MKIIWGIVVVVAVIVLFVVWWGSPGVRPASSPPSMRSPDRPRGEAGSPPLGSPGPRTDPSGAPGRPAATPGAKPSSP